MSSVSAAGRRESCISDRQTRESAAWTSASLRYSHIPLFDIAILLSSDRLISVTRYSAISRLPELDAICPVMMGALVELFMLSRARAWRTEHNVFC